MKMLDRCADAPIGVSVLFLFQINIMQTILKQYRNKSQIY